VLSVLGFLRFFDFSLRYCKFNFSFSFWLRWFWYFKVKINHYCSKP
jgi:hypothetical protein